MPLAIAAFSVGHSAFGSVADTMSALAPLVIAAWMAGICEAGVAAVPLVSVPVSPRRLSAAIAPPDFTLSAVVKYGLPEVLRDDEHLQAGLQRAGGRRPDEAAPEDERWSPRTSSSCTRRSVAEATRGDRAVPRGLSSLSVSS